MKDFLSSLRFKILVGLMIVLSGSIIASVYTGGAAPLFTQVVSLVTTPIQRVSANISGNVTGFFDQFLRAGQVYQENRLLREELAELREQLVDHQRAMHENEQFRAILGVMEDRQDLTFITADVIARDPNDRFYSFTIDKGSRHGVDWLDPVITADGLVGYITEVGFNQSRVATILDVSVAVSVYNSATRELGIVTGAIELAGNGQSELQFIPRESEISPGDLILTSGGSLFPRDLMIGRVASVGLSSHGTSLVAVIDLVAEVRSVQNVFVITSFDGQGMN
ncbi:MAG: rod shape-determining protein MreC [Oscillospiraceae bacterium]|nr:rod shape-determining protein MreC [Oscillospiraceae bacterium]